MPSLRKGLSLLKKNRVGEISFGPEIDEISHSGPQWFGRSRGSFLDAAGAQVLAKALKTNTSVTSLYLRGNPLGDAGAISLAEALEHNTSLEELDLSYNDIGDAGAIRLAEALEKNTTLRELLLSGNRIGNEGSMRLAQCLETNFTLRVISLLYNNIEEEGLLQLVQAIEGNVSLRGVMLSYRAATLELTSRVHDATSRNRVHRKAADILSTVVFVADGHLKIRDDLPLRPRFSLVKRRKSRNTPPPPTEEETKTIRFFNIMKKLPYDLQMIICSRMAELKSDYITFRFMSPALNEVARMVSRPS